MKIIQTPARFPPYVGGVEQYTYILSKKLVERGHDITVICADEPAGEPPRETYDGIDVVRLDYIGKIADTNLTSKIPIKLYRELQNADIIHTHLPTPWTADVSALIASLTGTSSVVTYHNDICGSGVAKYLANLYNATAMQVTLSMVDRIITTQESYFNNSNIPSWFEDKVTTIRNGVNVERFKPIDVNDGTAREYGFDPENTNLFFLSVLDEYHDYKGLENLLEAVRKLPQEYRLVVGGDGPKREYYEQRARELKLHNRVHFAGYIENDELPEYYNSSDVFVLPSTSSRQEGFGLVLLEALACGIPVVTTDVVGISKDVRNQDLGFVISSPCPSKISDSISTLTSEKVDFNSDRARAVCIDKYSWESAVTQMEDLYTHLLS